MFPRWGRGGGDEEDLVFVLSVVSLQLTHSRESAVSENVCIHSSSGASFQVRACDHISPGRNLFSSAQCLGFRLEHGQLSKELCFPSDKTVLAKVTQGFFSGVCFGVNVPSIQIRIQM